MRTKVIIERVAALERVIDALAEDLIAATDEELLQAATDLGMDPLSKGSAAFAGIKYPATWRFADFFREPTAPADQISPDDSSSALLPLSKRLSDRKKRSDFPGSGNESED